VKSRIDLWKPVDSDLSSAGAINLAIAFKALGDRHRVRMLSCLLADSPLCVGDFQEQLGLSQSLTSHHLGKLVDAGILECNKSGRRTWYWITEGALERLSEVLIERAS
jgi:DNA-binding transcriptional ArsR family regulator